MAARTENQFQDILDILVDWDLYDLESLQESISIMIARESETTTQETL